ncbi:MAG TPA: hypothetical protein DD490_21550 [Acidobacteria bacterium]|nr:hypothetical protein [Acidobacteriota bacterium]
MSTSILQWPAFAQLKALPSGRLHCERGIWGKAPGASTDYRWIARSSGFDTEGLAEQLTLGSEDQPVPAPLWLRQGDRYCAAAIYRSPASDAVGRSNFLEKQLLTWTPGRGTPAALGALLLLEQVASFDAKVWTLYREERAWQDPWFFLQLAAEEPTPIPGNLESLVARGVEELHASVERESLAGLYTQILAGRKPACLTGLEAPLSPLALAVLLLPLPRTIAETLSLAGWIPSGRASLADLGRRWDVIAVPPHLVEQAHRQEPADDQGWPLAKALLELQPERAVLVPSVPVQAAGSSARPPAEPPVAVHTLPLTPLEAVRPDARIALPAPPKGAPAWLEALHTFACAVEARWPDLGRWSRHPISELVPIHETLFPSWIRTLRELKPDAVDDAQWKVKLDVLRSAALVLRPGTNPDSVGAFESRRVPELLFALSVSPGLLAEMGQTDLRNALRNSLKCPANPWTRRLEQALREWPPVKRKPWVKALIQEELTAAGKS